MVENNDINQIGINENVKLDILSIVNDPKVPKFFANGFFVGHSLTEATLITQVGGTPNSVIFMSFASLKALHQTLGGLVKNIEKGLGHEIEDLQELQKKWNSNFISTEK